jgi:hypothetical protein
VDGAKRWARRWNAIRAGPHRRVTRRPITRRSTRVAVRCGLDAGREDRSTIPAPPWARYRSAHRLAVVTETPNRSAARRKGQP